MLIMCFWCLWIKAVLTWTDYLLANHCCCSFCSICSHFTCFPVPTFAVLQTHYRYRMVLSISSVFPCRPHKACELNLWQCWVTTVIGLGRKILPRSLLTSFLHVIISVSLWSSACHQLCCSLDLWSFCNPCFHAVLYCVWFYQPRNMSDRTGDPVICQKKGYKKTKDPAGTIERGEGRYLLQQSWWQIHNQSLWHEGTCGWIFLLKPIPVVTRPVPDTFWGWIHMLRVVSTNLTP